MGECYIKLSTARTNPTYTALVDECLQRFEASGFFHKQNALEKLDLAPFASSINWNFVLELIKEKYGGEMEFIPLAARFFKDDKNQIGSTELKVLGRYIAGGHGKRAAGYGNFTMHNGKFAVKVKERKVATKNGVSGA